MQLTTSISSGQTASPALYITRSDLFVACLASSAAPAAVSLHFAAGSGATPSPLCKPDGSGAVFLVVSGNAGWAVAKMPTPWIVVVQSPATTAPITLVSVA